MGTNLQARLDNQKRRTEIAEARVREEKAISALNRMDRIKSAYDALKTNVKRHSPPVSRKAPDAELSPTRRLKGAALGRYLEENIATFKSIQTQFKHNAVGADGPKLAFNTGNEKWDQAAANWFNHVWAKDCDGCDDTPLAEIVANVGSAIRREGDVLVVFDDFDRNDGTLRVFESDQLVKVGEPEWDKQISKSLKVWPWKERDPKDGRKFIPMKQENGVVRDRRGRVVAYIACSEHGVSTKALSEVSIFPRWQKRWQPNGPARLIKAPWRFGQYRGEGIALTIATSQQDIYEMISAELQSAKVAAQNAAIVTVDPESESAIIRALQSSNMSEDQIAAILYGDAGEGTKGMLSQTYEELDGLTGGKTVYANAGEDVKIHDHDRPSASIREFGDWLQVVCGAVAGLGRSRSTMKAETSYTAFRGEELMSWAAFAWEQKLLERRLMDYVGYKAIRWAVAAREVAGNAPIRWDTAMSWTWPAMQEVDQQKSENALRLALKNGHKMLSDVLGPDWKAKLTNYGEQLDYAEKLGLPLSVFETVSGSVVEEQKGKNDE